MKTYILSTFIIGMTFSGFAQYNEFKVHSNGLIYNESTMNRLEVIVDSLNLKFRTCDLSHPYYSIPQGFANYITNPSKEARKLMASGISFDEYERKYPRSIKKKNVWITKSRYVDYNDKAIIEYEGLPNGQGSAYSIGVRDRKENDQTKGWIISEDGDEAFYLIELNSVSIPYEYARLVQYVDCMIDTTAQIYFEGVQSNYKEEVSMNSKADEYISWAESFPRRPELPDYNKADNFDSSYEVFLSQYKVWDSLRMIHLDNQMATSRYWKSVLMEARDEGIENRRSDERLEFYVARYLSDKDALMLMRCRRVVGGCSQDLSPRFHAMNICRLAAQTAQWDIFLRSHLDIMNDRFERMSDGSYAWQGRRTYLKELEELAIPAVDLLVGTTLRVKNVSPNHYFGSIGRTGRALADAKDKASLEKKLLEMIQNEQLDPYNRLLLVYLFDNYVYNLEDDHGKKEGIAILNHTIHSLPEFMREVLAINK